MQERIFIQEDSEIQLNSENFNYEVMHLGFDAFMAWFSELPAEYFDRRVSFMRKYWIEIMISIN